MSPLPRRPRRRHWLRSLLPWTRHQLPNSHFSPKSSGTFGVVLEVVVTYPASLGDDDCSTARVSSARQEGCAVIHNLVGRDPARLCSRMPSELTWCKCWLLLLFAWPRKNRLKDNVAPSTRYIVADVITLAAGVAGSHQRIGSCRGADAHPAIDTVAFTNLLFDKRAVTWIEHKSSPTVTGCGLRQVLWWGCNPFRACKPGCGRLWQDGQPHRSYRTVRDR
jgi:hypothetical protein